MLSNSPLHNDLPRFSLKTKAKEVIRTINDNLTHLPIFSENGLIGMLPFRLIEENAQSNIPLQKLAFELEHFSAQSSMHWQEVLEIFGKYDTNVIPVLNEKMSYIGYYLLNDFIYFFRTTPFLQNLGRFIVIEKEGFYSFSEISRIVESNHSQLLGIFISEISANGVQITLKVTTHNVNAILDGFRRYGYAIVLEKEDDHYLQELKAKSDYFDKYLAM